MKNNDNPLVSVIVPVYNVEKYLDECVKSILAQSYKNLEIILVDDGSPDGCPEMCDNYQALDPRVRVIHKNNGGLGFARNSGLDIATGDYVVFVDSDDYLDSDAIEDLVTAAINNHAQLVKDGFRKRDDVGNTLYVRSYVGGVFKGKDIDTLFSPRLLGSSPSMSDSIEMSVWATLYDRSIIEQIHLRFDSERMVVSEDLPFNLTFLSHCNNVVLTDKITYNYRLNQNSLTEKYESGKFLRILEFFDIMNGRFPELITRENTRFSRLFFVYLKKYIKHELLNKEASPKMIISRIAEICDYPMVIQRIQTYPIDKLPVKHRIFLKLVKRKKANILYFLAKCKAF